VSRGLRRMMVGTAATGAVAAGLATVVAVRGVSRERVARSARVWRLTARRGAHWAVVKVRGAAADDARRAALEEQFAIRTAEDVAAELGQMKGALMKLGQLVSVIADGLPDEARAALAQLQADVPPMAPSLAAQVVREELGEEPERRFLEWEPVPVAAASVGQVHRAVLHDGRRVAVKVQYPGAADAIMHDLDNAEGLYAMASAVALRGLDARALVDELRARMAEELDYENEAANQRSFAERFADHPFIRVPGVVPEHSARRVMTSEWVDGFGWSELLVAPSDVQQRASEVIFRFAQSGVHRYYEFNGDPHPGNYRFHDDGTVTFLDFGLVKRWGVGEHRGLLPLLDPVLDQNPAGTVAHMENSGFLARGHGLDPQLVFDCVSAPYRPFFETEFTFTPGFAAEAMRAVADITGPCAPVVRALNLPASFVILNRVLWGVSGLLGQLHATNQWRGILDEYRRGTAPVTPLGEAEVAWAAAHRSSIDLANWGQRRGCDPPTG
jgi:predicted unusual protein kinase regulating ubiquinone biosynthesis (AarF/ABC1/UbiB family)